VLTGGGELAVDAIYAGVFELPGDWPDAPAPSAPALDPGQAPGIRL